MDILDGKLKVKLDHTTMAACQEVSTHVSKINYVSYHFRP